MRDGCALQIKNIDFVVMFGEYFITLVLCVPHSAEPSTRAPT